MQNNLLTITKKSALCIFTIVLLLTCYGLANRIFAATAPYWVSYHSFNNDAQAVSMKDAQTDSKGVITLSKNTYTRSGFAFLGWATSDYGKVVYNDGQKVTLANDVSLYAKYKMTDKTKAKWGLGFETICDNSSTSWIVSNYCDGSTAEVNYSKDKYFDTNNYKIVAIVVTHTKGDVSSQQVYTPSDFKYSSTIKYKNDTISMTKASFVMYDDVNLWLIYTKKSPNKSVPEWVIYHPNASDVSGGMDITSYYGLDANSSRLNKNTFYKTGHKFAGWSTSPTGSVVYSNGALIFSSGDEGKIVNLYAKWTPNTYNVTFNANGGTGTMSKQTVKYNTATALNANAFKRTYYKFKGWSASKNGSVAYADKAKVKLTSDLTLYAQWDQIKYTVTFNKNGGSGTMSKETFSAGSSKALSANKFTKKGYKFKGWATSKGGKVVYKNKQSIKATKNMTLYAVWGK